MKKDFPNRKHPRLKNYDYSKSGAYFITICTQNRRCILSQVVGRGLAPAETSSIKNTIFGEIAECQLLSLEKRYSTLKIDCHVIMPNHIHVVMFLDNEAAGASPRPTIMDIVCTYKSLTTIECKKSGHRGSLFQPSFHEHIIRNLEDYKEIVKYIAFNPKHWYHDKLYSDY